MTDHAMTKDEAQALYDIAKFMHSRASRLPKKRSSTARYLLSESTRLIAVAYGLLDIET
jgi:hypothetical protein